MSSERLLIPQIRFKGFTEAWEQRKLGELGLAQSGIGFPNTEQGGTEGTPFFKVSDMNMPGNEHELVASNNYVTPEQIARMGWHPINQVPAIFFAKVGAAVMLNRKRLINKPFLLDNNTMAFSIDSSSLNTQFGQSLFERIDLTSLIQIGALPSYNSSDVERITVSLPSTMDEQCRIGQCLCNINDLITLHQRKLDALKKIKSALLEKMFPKNGSNVPEIRFTGFTEAWEQRKLGDFGKATGGTSIESEFSEDGIYKVISIGSYSENSVYNDQEIRAIKSDKTSNRVLNRNDLTMILNDKTTSGNIIGRVLLIEESGIYVYNQRTERIEIYLDEYDSVFLYEMLNAPNIRGKIIKQAQGNTQIYVNWTAISLLEYMIPSKEEQVKIGEYLHSISNLITLHQRKLDALKKIKSALLEKMFV